MQKPLVIWFTGLSGSGKTTLSESLQAELNQLGFHTYLLDGDKLRDGLCSDLDFSPEGRSENMRRAGEVARLMWDAGLVVICAFISPFESDREKVRQIIGAENIFRVFVDCPLEVCEQRDVKGLYRKARLGAIEKFTGISSPFEAPLDFEARAPSAEKSVEDITSDLLNAIVPRISRH